MKRRGRARRQALVTLVPDLPVGAVVVDVGADHGHVAAALGAFASERLPGIPQRDDLAWVIADGLAPWRAVDVAIVAGMGARTIAGILARGPRPRVAAVLHAQDDPIQLRQWLATHGWRIDAEALAPEAGRYAEVVRAVPGVEPSTGERLALGPRLQADGHPLWPAHLRQILGHWTSIRDQTEGRAPERHAVAARRVDAILALLDSCS